MALYQKSCVHSDNTRKFLHMKRGLDRLGIALTNPPLSTMQINELAKEVYKILLDKSGTIVGQTGFPEQFRAEAIKQAGDLYNPTAMT